MEGGWSSVVGGGSGGGGGDVAVAGCSVAGSVISNDPETWMQNFFFW